METGINILDRERCFISTDDRVLYGKIRRLAEQNPGTVNVIAEPENNDGTWYGTIPSEWVKIGLPRKIELTDEQREKRAERMKNIRLNTRNEGKADE